MNIMAIITLFVLAWKVTEGYKRGMVREIISFVSLIMLCVVTALLENTLRGYLHKEWLAVLTGIFLLAILGIAHHLLGIVFFSAKLVAGLPVIKSGDKLMGLVIGVLETVLILWMVLLLVMNFPSGMLGQQLLAYVEANPVLSWLYRYNLLARLVEQLPALPFLAGNMQESAAK